MIVNLQTPLGLLLIYIIFLIIALISPVCVHVVAYHVCFCVSIKIYLLLAQVESKYTCTMYKHNESSSTILIYLLLLLNCTNRSRLVIAMALMMLPSICDVCALCKFSTVCVYVWRFCMFFVFNKCAKSTSCMFPHLSFFFLFYSHVLFRLGKYLGKTFIGIEIDHHELRLCRTDGQICFFRVVVRAIYSSHLFAPIWTWMIMSLESTYSWSPDAFLSRSPLKIGNAITTRIRNTCHIINLVLFLFALYKLVVNINYLDSDFVCRICY